MLEHTLIEPELKQTERLEALRATGLLDSEPEQAFDRQTRLAAKFLGVPISLVSLVDDHRQFFKSCVGLPDPWDKKRETPLSHSFCRLAVVKKQPLIINDARIDPRVADNLAVSELGVIAYLGIPIRDPAGHILGSFCVIDVKPREWSAEDAWTVEQLCRSVETEIALRLKLGDQDETITTLTDDRDEWVRRAEVADLVSRRKSLFFAKLSHELRNPLSPICTAVDLLREDRVDAGERPEMYRLIDEQLRQLVRLIDDMLDLSRIERGKLSIDSKPVDMAEVVRSALASVRTAIEESSLQVTRVIEAGPLTVTGDRDRLIQVVSNLLTNACRYTPPGGRIRLECQPDDATILLRVTDSGIGIPAESIGRIFNVFEQAGSDVPREESGLGIGLAIVRELVELHGGSVAASSGGPDRGSEFVIRLPRDQNHYPVESLAPPTSDDPPGEVNVPPLRILAVEDTRATAFMFERLLQKLGHQVTVVHRVDEAIERIGDPPPELIFSDLEMPDKDGFEFAAMLKSDPATRDIPLVALTGRAHSQDRDETRRAGFDAHMVKPIDIRDLRRFLAERFGQPSGS